MQQLIFKWGRVVVAVFTHTGMLVTLITPGPTLSTMLLECLSPQLDALLPPRHLACRACLMNQTALKLTPNESMQPGNALAETQTSAHTGEVDHCALKPCCPSSRAPIAH